MMNRTAKEPSTSPIVAEEKKTAHSDDDDEQDDDVLDSDSEDDDKLKSIHALRGGKVNTNSSKNDKAPPDVKADKNDEDGDDGDDEDDDDDEEETEDQLLANLHLNNPSIRRYDEFSSFLTRSERAHEKPDVPPSLESMARRRVTILVDAVPPPPPPPPPPAQLPAVGQQEPAASEGTNNKPGDVDDAATSTTPAATTSSSSAAVAGITIHYDTGAPMTADEIKAYFMQPEDFRRCDVDVDLTTIRWNKAQSGQYKWNDQENTIRGLEEVVATAIKNKKNRKNRKKTTTATISRSDFRYNHAQKVLAEVVRQKMENINSNSKKATTYDHDKIRQVSIIISEPERQRARQLAQQDQDEVVKMHHPRWKNLGKGGNDTTTSSSTDSSSDISSSGGTAIAKKDSKKGFFSFLQRNSSKKL